MSDPLRRELPKVDAGHLTIALGMLYVFGFIVANVHFGRYELPRIELLRARYLAAALLFILCSAIPFAVGAFLSRVSRTRAPGDGPRERGLKLRETEAWAMGARAFFSWLVLGVFLYEGLLWQLMLRSPGALAFGTLYFAMVTITAWQVCDSLLGGPASDDAQLWPSLRLSHRVLYTSLFVIIVPTAFSLIIYGSMKPELGGGALWKARLTWQPTADSSARAIASGVVAIVDRDEQTLNLIACAQSGPPALVSIPTADVSSIQLGELVSPQWFMDDYASDCRNIRPEPKSPTEKKWSLLAHLLLAAGLVVLPTTVLYGLMAAAQERPNAPE